MTKDILKYRKNDGRIYNQPTMYEVAALIVGDVDTAGKKRYHNAKKVW